MFDVRCSMFNVQCSMFDVRCSMFDVRCSMFDVRCSMFDVLPSHNLQEHERLFPFSFKSPLVRRASMHWDCALCLAGCAFFECDCSVSGANGHVAKTGAFFAGSAAGCILSCGLVDMRASSGPPIFVSVR